MQSRTTIGSARAVLGAGLRGWLAAFGQCPPPDRDVGIGAWPQLRRGPRRGDEAPLSLRPLADDPHLAIGTSL